MRIKFRQAVILSCFFMFTSLFFLWFHVYNVHRAALLPTKLNEKLRILFGGFAKKSYFEKCFSIPKWNSSSKWPPVESIAEKLKLTNGESIFVNGIEHCGVWLQALHSKYPKSAITAVDGDVAVINSAKKDVNFTSEVAVAHNLMQLDIPDNKKFDHGLTEDSLSSLPAAKQCNAVRQMLPLIKAGGSIYLGHNYEKCRVGTEIERQEFEMFVKQRQLELLPSCFWGSECLHGRSDVYEVLYDNQHDIYDAPDAAFPLKTNPCRTSVYIYKHVQVSADKHKDTLLFDSRYREAWTTHPCSQSKFPNETRIDKVKSDRDSIKGALIKVKPWLDV